MGVEDVGEASDGFVYKYRRGEKEAQDSMNSRRRDKGEGSEAGEGELELHLWFLLPVLSRPPCPNPGIHPPSEFEDQRSKMFL